MAWKFAAGIPLTTQLADRLRGEILLGKYPMGGAFPTVRALAEMASVNPNTVQRALVILEGEGLLVTHTTVGRFVTEDDAVLRRAAALHEEKFICDIVTEAKKRNLECEHLIACIRKGWTN